LAFVEKLLVNASGCYNETVGGVFVIPEKMFSNFSMFGWFNIPENIFFRKTSSKKKKKMTSLKNPH